MLNDRRVLTKIGGKASLTRIRSPQAPASRYASSRSPRSSRSPSCSDKTLFSTPRISANRKRKPGKPRFPWRDPVTPRSPHVANFLWRFGHCPAPGCPMGLAARRLNARSGPTTPGTPPAQNQRLAARGQHVDEGSGQTVRSRRSARLCVALKVGTAGASVNTPGQRCRKGRSGVSTSSARNFVPRRRRSQTQVDQLKGDGQGLGHSRGDHPVGRELVEASPAIAHRAAKRPGRGGTSSSRGSRGGGRCHCRTLPPRRSAHEVAPAHVAEHVGLSPQKELVARRAQQCAACCR
jgi:hypothetical protein